MKKKIICASALALTLSALSVSALPTAAADSINVYVTISDSEGKLVLAEEKTAVSDTDGDGKFTINDALYTAHEKKYKGGAKEGYSAVESQYGLSMEKLWGVENGGSYGYYVNNESALALLDEIKEGDKVNAYVITDLEGWSDKYCWFETDAKETAIGDEIAVTLLYAGYDENWSPVTSPVENAVITLNGEKTSFKTDSEGKAVVKLDKSGDILISASSEELILVPPVLKLSVSEPATEAPSAPVTEVLTEPATEPEKATESPKKPETDKKPSSVEVNPATADKNSGSSSSDGSSPHTGNNGIAAIAALLSLSASAAFITRKNK